MTSHSCNKRSGWSIFSIDTCDGCVRGALLSGYEPERLAFIRTHMRARQGLPKDDDVGAPGPEDLAHVTEIFVQSNRDLRFRILEAFERSLDTMSQHGVAIARDGARNCEPLMAALQQELGILLNGFPND